MIYTWVQFAEMSRDEHSRTMRMVFDVRVSGEGLSEVGNLSDVADAVVEAVRASFKDEKAQALSMLQMIRSER